MLTTKLWHTSSFLLVNIDSKNYKFENIPWAHSEVAKVKGGRMVKEPDLKAEKIQVIRTN